MYPQILLTRLKFFPDEGSRKVFLIAIVSLFFCVLVAAAIQVQIKQNAEISRRAASFNAGQASFLSKDNRNPPPEFEELEWLSGYNAASLASRKSTEARKIENANRKLNDEKGVAPLTSNYMPEVSLSDEEKERRLKRFQNDENVSDAIIEAACKKWVLDNWPKYNWDVDDVIRISREFKQVGIPRRYLPENQK